MDARNEFTPAHILGDSSPDGAYRPSARVHLDDTTITLRLGTHVLRR